MLQSIHFVLPNTFLTFSHPLVRPPNQTFLNKPTPTPFSLSSNSRQWPLIAASAEEGPIELSPDVPSIFATNDDPTPLQVATSVLLTGAISVFLFRAVRRRVKRAKELRVRSSGAKSLKEEALDSLKVVGTVSVESKAPPSPAQAFLGAIAAGVIALILYKFTTTIEAALNRQAVSDNFSGTKQNMSNSKNRPHPIPETPNSNNGQAKIDKSKSEKSLSELEVEELQGFKDLGFSFDNNNLSPSVKQVLPALQRRASLGSSKNNNNNNQVDDNIIIGNNKVKRPYLSESWEKASYHPLSAPPHPTRRYVPSSDDMKAQIKFWARAVALNVHQEC